MTPLRFAMLGCGFWARYQLAAWRELPGATCVAVCDSSLAKAEQLAGQFGVTQVYDDAERLFDEQSLDFADIVTQVESHGELVERAIQHRLPVICQKPLAPSLRAAQELVASAEAAGVPLLVHENWRWQAPLRRLNEILKSGRLGPLVRARIDYANSFPVFDNQPALKELEQFILTDIGTHILDVARFLFGEAAHLYCQTRRMKQDIAGEDVATVMLRMQDGLTVTCNMSYASRWELDRFPQTFVAVEGTRGGVSLGADYEIVIVDELGEHRERIAIPHYAWANPDYALVHASIVECHRNLLGFLQGQEQAETDGRDNLQTLGLVFGAYESATSNAAIAIEQDRSTP